MRKVLATLLLLGATGLTGQAYAAEAGPLNWGPGQLDTDFGALPPIPGLFISQKVGVINSSHNNDNSGNPSKLYDFKQHGVVDITKLLAVWPVDFHGLRTATIVIAPFGRMKTDFDVIPVEGWGSGLGNVNISQTFDYSLGGFHHLDATIGYTSKLAAYSSKRAQNFGTGYSSVITGLGYNYQDPRGLDAGFVTQFHANQRNDSTGFQTGNMVSFDFKLMYAVSEKWKIGAYGGYLKQIEDDRLPSGAKLENNRFAAISLGPEVSYDFGPVRASLSYLAPVMAKNAAKSNAVWLSLSAPLYIPKHPEGL